MLEVASILRTATQRSVVLMDEFGRGTSTADGCRLARAVSKEIVRKRFYSVFSTHFPEMASLAKECESVKNYHASDDYKIEPGTCHESNGIRVAQMVNLPAAVVDDAVSHRDLLRQGSEAAQVIERLRTLSPQILGREYESVDDKVNAFRAALGM